MKLIVMFFILLSISDLKTEATLKGSTFLSKIFVKFFKQKLDHIIEDSRINTKCANDMKALFTDFIFMKRWALEMVDASAKIPSGLLAGNYMITGNFDQCLNIQETKTNRTINGQYCTVILTPSTKFSSEFSFVLDSIALADYLGMKTSYQGAEIIKFFKVTYGLCIPDSCSIENLQNIWNYVEQTFRIPVHLTFLDFMCRSNTKLVEPYTVDKYIMVGFVIYAAVVLLSTCYDIILHQHIQPEKLNIWISFSLYTNFKKIFSHSRVENGRGYLECINGIKILSMLWIILAHRFLMNFFSGTINTVYLLKWKEELTTTFISASPFATDTFLALSGLLLAYGFLKYKSTLMKGEKFRFRLLYMYRLLRLGPALLATILFYVAIFKRLNDGPIWPLIARKLAGSCLRTWWTTILFVTNLVDINYQCLEHSWYLAVDSQLFFISPLLLTQLEVKPRRTCWLLLSACAISGLFTYALTVKNNYGAICFDANKPSHQNIYQPTLLRMPAWLIGVIFGFLLFKYPKIKIPKVTNVLAWMFLMIMFLCLLLVHLVFTRYEYNPVSSGIYNAFARQIWSLAVCSVVFLCSTGHGGPINRFLSLPVFHILVKISYSFYLIHFAVLLYFGSGKKHPEYFSNIKGVHDFLGDLFFVFIAGTVWCLMFESPFIAVGKILMNTENNLQLSKKLRKKDKRSQFDKTVCVYNTIKDKNI